MLDLIMQYLPVNNKILFLKLFLKNQNLLILNFQLFHYDFLFQNYISFALFIKFSTSFPSFFPSLIFLEILFLSALISSSSCLSFLQSSSNFFTLSTIFKSFLNFFFIFSFTSSGFSRINFISIMC